MSIRVPERITLERAEDGWWVASDEETDIASQGPTREAALDNLDEALAGVDGEGRPPTDDELRAVGIDPDDNEQAGSGELPDVLQ